LSVSAEVELHVHDKVRKWCSRTACRPGDAIGIVRFLRAFCDADTDIRQNVLHCYCPSDVSNIPLCSICEVVVDEYWASGISIEILQKVAAIKITSSHEFCCAGRSGASAFRAYLN